MAYRRWVNIGRLFKTGHITLERETNPTDLSEKPKTF